MIDEDGLEILRAERRFSYPRRKVRADATIDGEWVGDIGVRMRGGIGSFSRFDHKPKLELDLNEYTGERFHGLESLSLNNMISDCSGFAKPWRMPPMVSWAWPLPEPAMPSCS